MQISSKGLNLIKSFEGLELKVYADAVGLATIGYGHLLKPGEHYQTIDESTAEEILRQDVKSFEACVNKAVTAAINQNQFDALVCFAFNVGAGNFRSSTLLKLLNQALYAEAAQQFLRWDKAGGRPLAGLTRRRHAEMQLFLS